MRQTYPVDALTPIEHRGPLAIKRDDLCEVAGVRGGKVRTCWHLAQGAPGLITAGSRESPQVNIVAHIAAALGVPCRVHTPEGVLSPEVEMARDMGAEIRQHRAGYNNVINARARQDARMTGWTEIPFGMKCREAVRQTQKQVANIPSDTKRIVIPVGSGMSLAGVLWGLIDRNMDVPVLGVRVGADPKETLDQYAPWNWRNRVQLTTTLAAYHTPAPTIVVEGLTVDPHYEAKCIPYLEPGDLFWVVGLRQSIVRTLQGGTR